MTKEENRDHVTTTVYIFTELMGNPPFMSYIDRAMDMATDFIKIYPLKTDWGKQNWEDALYDFYNNYKK